jgi:hypothetical protein
MSAEKLNKPKKTFPGGAGPGRPRGVPNKNTALLKDAILEAAALAGDKEGMTGYLQRQAQENPTAFLTLLGKVLPLQVVGDKDAPLQIVMKTVYEQKP